MNKRKNVLDSIMHKQPETIPWDIRFTKKAHTLMADYYKDPQFYSKIDNCFTIIRTNIHNEIEPGIWEDQFGVKWDRRTDPDIGTVAEYQITLDNVKSYNFPNPDNPSLYAHYRNEIEASDPDTFKVAKMSYNLFERAWSLCGFEQFLMYMMNETEFANWLLDEILKYNLKVIDNLANYNVDCVFFGDDWGQQTGLIMGPQLWNTFIEPRIKIMYAAVKSRKLYVMHHSCGNITEIIPQLIEDGLDILNPFQPEAMDIYQIKKQYGHRLSFYGGISTQKTLPFESVEKTRELTKRLIEEVGQKGGLIVSAAHAIPPDAKPENINAMIETLKGQ